MNLALGDGFRTSTQGFANPSEAIVVWKYAREAPFCIHRGASPYKGRLRHRQAVECCDDGGVEVGVTGLEG